MPDLDPLPHRPAKPVLAPRTGDYAGVVRRARRRRRAHLGTAGAGLASVLAVMVLATANGGGTVGLDPVQPATGVTAANETPPPGESLAPEPEQSDEPAAGETAGAGATAAPSDDPDTPATEAAGDQGGPPADGEGDDPAHERPPAARPAVARDDVAYGPLSCDTDPSFVTPAGWCMGYDGPGVVRGGDPHDYRLLVCRHVGRGAGTLTFETEQQVEYVVSAAREEWHWSGGYRFPRRETRVTVPEARCARWTVTWDATDDDGDLLRPGTYWMSPSLAPARWSGDMNAAVTVAYQLDVAE